MSRRVYGGSIFFSLVLILRIPAYLGIKGGRFFSDLQIGVLHTKSSDFYAKLNVSNLYVPNYVLVLVQTDLIQFENSNHIRSICTKTNTNSLHTILMHSISCNIGHIIQIVVHQFVHKTRAKKKPL